MRRMTDRRLRMTDRRRIRQSAKRRGLTLMELMVAITIFALVMSSLFFAFNTGVRAYKVGSKHSEGSQTARYTVAQVTTDLRNVFYRTPASYNVTRRQREAVIAEREKNALRSGRVRSRQELREDETLPELGPKIDLAFRASDGGEVDSLTFVRLQGEKIGRDRQPWGLARVHYYVAEGALWRAVEDVTAPEEDEYGELIPKAVPPRVDKLANGVTGFDLKFGYFGEEGWTTANDWDSDSPVYRNPPDEELDPDDSAAPGRTTAGVLEAPGQQGQNSVTGQQPNQPDDLPAWVEITFRFGGSDPENQESGSEKVYRQIVQLPASQETYLPPDPTADDPRYRGHNRPANNRRGTGGDSGSGRRMYSR